MEATVLSNRRSRRVLYNKHYILKVETEKYKDKKSVSDLIGKKAIFTSIGGKKINGKIVTAHGNNGAVRAIFEKGLPGTAIGEKVEIK